MCKNAYGQIIFCALHIFLLLLLMYIGHVILLDQDLFRHVLSHIFVLNWQNVFDITILYIISETRVKKVAQPTPEINWPLIASMCLESCRKRLGIIKYYPIYIA